MTFIEAVIKTIENATGQKCAVKGGNVIQPLEYFYSRSGVFRYRFELYVNGNDLLKVQSTTDLIMNTIHDFGDMSKFHGSHIDSSGGGCVTSGNAITQVLYFDVIDKGGEVDPPLPRPEGTITITANGDYDVTRYASAHVNTPGSGYPEYEGEVVVEPRRVEQTLETAHTSVMDDIKVLKIYEAQVSNDKGTTFYIGKE